MGSCKWNDSFHWIWSESFHHLTLPWDVTIPISFSSCCFTEIQLINCDWLGFKYSVGFAFFGIQKMLPGMVNWYPGLCKISQRDSKFQMMLTYTGPVFMSLSQANFPAEVLSEIFTVCLEDNSSPWRWQQMFLWEKHTCIRGPWTDSGVLMPLPLSINGLQKFGMTTERKYPGLTSTTWPSLVGLASHCANIISTALSQLTASGAVFFFFFF